MNKSKIKLYAIVVILVIATITFRIINDALLEQTSILFIGIPALITILVIKQTKSPKGAYGVVFRVITLFLLMSSILLGEGIVCILFMAPIFYGVGALLVFLIKLGDKDEKINSFIIIPIALIFISQPHEIKREHEIISIHNKISINHKIDFTTFKKTKNLSKDLPVFFDLGFPMPTNIETSGIKKGDVQTIKFKSSTKGIGELSLIVNEVTSNNIVFNVKSDNTHINHWLTWKKITVRINPINNSLYEVIWTTDFECDLGPSWYFKPLEKYAVGLMNQHLLNVYFN